MSARTRIVVDSVLHLIGNTPLLRLHRLTEGLRADVLVKAAYLGES